MKDKTLRQVIFGANHTGNATPKKSRTFTLTNPPRKEGEYTQEYIIESSEGIFCYLMNHIKELQKRLDKLEKKKK